MDKQMREKQQEEETEQERGGRASCPRVNRENWARIIWDDNADRTRKTGVWRVRGGNWGASDENVVFTQSLNPAARGLFPLL